MCFVIDRLFPYERVATEDMMCWKLLHQRMGQASYLFKSPYRNYTYCFKYSNTVKQPDGFKFEFGETTIATTGLTEIIKKEIVKTIDKGFHSYSIRPYLEFDSMFYSEMWKGVGKCVIQMVIPKGAKYYYNSERNEFVSDELTYVKTIWKDGRLIKNIK